MQGVVHMTPVADDVANPWPVELCDAPPAPPLPVEVVETPESLQEATPADAAPTKAATEIARQHSSRSFIAR
jgi:hypothetical protein